MTFLEIEILSWYACRVGDYREGDFDAPAVRRAITEFRDDLGLLQQSASTNATYEITDRGRAYLEAIKAVPLPIQKWVMPELLQ